MSYFGLFGQLPQTWVIGDSLTLEVKTKQLIAIIKRK